MRRAVITQCLAVVASRFLVSSEGAELRPDAELPWRAAPDFARPSYTVQQWTPEDGLPQHTVKKVARTRRGFLWVGTWNGLARFDGLRFTSFTLGNMPDLISDNVSALLEDREGHLWIGTHDDGVIRFSNGRFACFGKTNGLSSLRIRALGQDREGVLWVGATYGLFRFSGERFDRVRLPPWIRQDYIGDIQVGPKGRLWVAARKAILIFEHGVLVETIPSGLPLKHLRFDAEGTPWLTTHDQLLATVINGAVNLQDSPVPLHPICLGSDRAGLVIGTEKGGVYRLVIHDGKIEATHQIREPDGHAIMDIYRDDEENIWLGVEAGGLERLRPKQVFTLNATHGLPSTALYSISQAGESSIWAATSGELYRWRENRFKPILIDSTGTHVTTVLQTRDGTLWCGLFFGPLFSRKPGGEWTTNTSRSIGFRALYEGRDGALWVGTRQSGVERWRDGKLTRWTESKGLSHEGVFAISEDASGSVWIGTARGLNHLQNGKMTVYRREDGLGSEQIRALCTDRGGTLWIGSVAGGLVRYRDGQFRRITTREGLRHNWVEQIIEDDYGFLWLGTSAGIMRVSLSELNRCANGEAAFIAGTSFGRSEGMDHPGCGTGYQPSCAKTPDGQLWFATGGGIVVVNPKSVRSESGPPDVYLESLVVDGAVAMDLAAHPLTEPQLAGRIPPGRPRFEFHYTSANLSAPKAVKFRYRLTGYDPAWVEAGTDRVAHYAGVPPGQYRFHVVAANQDGAWSDKGATMAVIVLRSWWQTWWFRSSATAAALALAILAYRHRMRRLQEIERMRLRIASDLHDDVGSNLGSIALLSQSAHREADASSAPAFREIHRLAQDTAESMRDIVWFINPDEDQLDKLALRMKEAAAMLLSGTKWEFSTPDELPIHSLSPEFKRHVFMIFKECLNNIRKHAQAANVVIQLKAPSTLELTIRDDGIGFDPALRACGHGLDNMERRADENGWQLRIVSRPGAGTTVHLSAPLD